MSGSRVLEEVPNRRVFFIHVMRTGGTTLLAHVRRSFPPEAVYPAREGDFPGGELLAHLDFSHLRALPEARRRVIEVYTGHLPACAPEMLALPGFRLTVLRDPVDRTLSVLRMLRDRRFPDRPLEEIYDDPVIFEGLIHDHQTKIFSLRLDDPVNRVLDPLALGPERLDAARMMLRSFDLVGVHDLYDGFLAALHDALGWPIDLRVHLNAAAAASKVPASFRRRIEADNRLDRCLYEFARGIAVGRPTAPPG